MSNRLRWALLATVVASLIGGAGTVFLVGSHNRRSDRNAVLRYEAAVTAQVREMVVVAGSLESAADAFAQGRLGAAAFATSAAQWQKTLAEVAGRLEAVTVPVPFGAGERMFGPAAREFAKAAGLYASFAACAQNSVGPSASCIATATATATADRALSLYRKAVRVLQSTRERLGLGRSANFPESLPLD